MRIGIWGVSLSLCLTGACSEAPGETAHLDVRWQGAKAGSVAGTATAGWCAHERVLEIRSVQGDTGIALALYPGKTLVPGVYRVVDPVKAESVPPAAGVAVRWPTENKVQGFQGDSGRVALELSSSGRLSGSVRARARSVVDTERIVLTGTFKDLTLLPDSLACPPPEPVDDDGFDMSDQDAEPGDTGIH